MKTPNLSPVKTRLIAELGHEKTGVFYALALKATEDLMKKVSQDFSCLWAVHEKQAMDFHLWKSFPRLFQGEGGLGEKLFFIYSQLILKTSVLFIGMDSPQISYRNFYKIKESLETNESDFVLGLAEDGGFYIFGASQRVILEKKDFTNITYSSSETGLLFSQILKKKGRLQFLETQTDLDRKEDFKKLKWPLEEEILISQKKLKNWVENFLSS